MTIAAVFLPSKCEWKETRHGIEERSTRGRAVARRAEELGQVGPDDEVGSLNYLTQAEVLRGVAAVRSGKTFTLQIQMGHPKGDPVWPGRAQARRLNVMDKGHYLCGKGPVFPGEGEYADDMMIIPAGLDPVRRAGPRVVRRPAVERLRCRVDHRRPRQGQRAAHRRARRGRARRADRHGAPSRQDVLDPGETFTHRDLLQAAETQGVRIEKHDILIIRTGWIGSFYHRDQTEFYQNFIEPGLTYSPELVEWFHKMEIPNPVTDTIANEVTMDPVSGVALPLHNALMRNPA